MNKLTKIAKILDVVFLVVAILILVAFVFVSFGAGIMLFSGTSFETALMSDNVSLDPNLIAILPDSGNPNSILCFTLFIVIGVLMMACLLYGVHIIRKILRPMKQGRPFDISISHSFKKLGWVEIVYLALSFLCSLAGTIARADSSLTINLQPLLLAGIFFLFSCIFRYGEELQKQADETL